MPESKEMAEQIDWQAVATLWSEPTVCVLSFCPCLSVLGVLSGQRKPSGQSRQGVLFLLLSFCTGCTVLDMPESKEMTEQIGWWAMCSLLVAFFLYWVYCPVLDMPEPRK